MPKLVIATLGTAVAAAALVCAGSASAYTATVGGLAGACSQAAKDGKHDERALEFCSLALASEPLNVHDRAGTFVNRGAMHLLNKENAEAHADFAAAIRIEPDMGEAHVGEGGYLISQQRYRDAEAEITHGITLDTEQPERAYYFRGVARWGQDDYRGAYFDFKKAAELKPGWTDPVDQLVYFKVTPTTP